MERAITDPVSPAYSTVYAYMGLRIKSMNEIQEKQHIAGVLVFIFYIRTKFERVSEPSKSSIG